MPKPYDGRLYVLCHGLVPSVRRPTSTVIPGPQPTESFGGLTNENGLTGRMKDGVAPARTNQRLLASACATAATGQNHNRTRVIPLHNRAYTRPVTAND